MERELLEHFCTRITSRSRADLLHFQCTEIDVSHPQYIGMETFKPGQDHTLPVQIPHWLVFLISGADERAPIGFLGG